jgi:hypothetical protein
MTNQPDAPIAWHCLLGEVLEKLLSPVGLLAYTELSVMNKPPKVALLNLQGLVKLARKCGYFNYST